MANKMADKKKNASRSQMVSPSAARSEEKEQSKSVKAMARERDERKERDNKSGSSRSSSKQSTAASARVTRFRNNRIVRFARDAYYELRYKVTWPTFEEARNMTFVVIGLSAAVGILLGLADFGLTRLFFLITGRQ